MSASARTSAACPRTVPVLDLDHLARQTFGDADLEREVLRLFVAQCTRLRPMIAGAASDDERADGAHTLKGSARAVGAFAVGEAAHMLEAFLRCQPRAPAQPLVEQLDEAISQTRAALAAYLGETI